MSPKILRVFTKPTLEKTARHVGPEGAGYSRQPADERVCLAAWAGMPESFSFDYIFNGFFGGG